MPGGSAGSGPSSPASHHETVGATATGSAAQAPSPGGTNSPARRRGPPGPAWATASSPATSRSVQTVRRRWVTSLAR